MRKSRFTEAQMVTILREADKGPVAEVAKKHGISEQTIYTWRKRYGVMDADEVKRLRQMEQENARLKKLRKRPATTVFPPKLRCLKMPCGRAPQICAHKGIYGHKFKGSHGLEAARPLPASPVGAEASDR